MNAVHPSGENRVPLGYFSSVHGVKGWLKVHSWTQPVEAILDYQPWWVGDEPEPVRVACSRTQGKALLVSLTGVEDRDQARTWVGREISVARERLPEPEPGSYYWADLQGLNVVNREGVPLGRIVRMIETGANDVMVVLGERERLVPWVPGQYVLDVDLAAGRVEVDWDPEF